jgi:hypothetical protein
MRKRLLVRHFLQRFLDHDLISPQADRRHLITVTSAMVIVSTLFLSVFVAVKYQFDIFMPPGLTALFALDDRFFWLSLSTLVMALIAVAEWDALALDARDTAVLGPLPIPRTAIVRAKFAAVALFVVGFDVALILAPTVLRVAALPVMLPVTLAGVLILTMAHAACGLAAGAFGFIAVLGVRETLRALVGLAGFRKVSAGLQALLVVFLATSLLLLPVSYGAVARRWMTSGRVTPFAVPPLWFVGLHETLAGRAIDGLPRGVPPRRYAAAEYQATALYRSLWPLFHRLAVVAALALVLVVVVTAAACVWNSRRLPTPPIAEGGGPGPLGRAFIRFATHLAVRDSATQAGFFFTLQCLARSATHRITIATSLALGLALVVVNIGGIDGPRASAPSTLPIHRLAVQTWVLAAVLTAFRHAVRVPAEVGANWTFHLAWPGDERPYLAGVKRAGLLTLVIPTLALLFAWHAVVMVPRLALEHVACGAAIAVLMMELFFLRYQKLPFASGYVRTDDLKSLVPLYVVAVLLVSLALAGLERAALANTMGSVIFFGALLAAIGGVHAADVRRRRTRRPIDLDEPLGGTIRALELVR